MTKIIAVALQKGGVGKTTTTQHLSHALAVRGHQVLMIDFDPQCSLSNRYDLSGVQFTMSDVLGVGGENEELQSLKAIVIPTHQQGLYLAPCSDRLALTNTHLDRAQDGVYQLDMLLHDEPLPFAYVIIDTPPGQSALLLSALVSADEVVVPVQLSPMGFEGFAQIDKTVQATRKLQRVRGAMRLEYRAVVPTFYSRGEQISDAFLEVLRGYEHPDYEDVALPVSEPIPETTQFEQASAPRRVNGEASRRALTIWDRREGIAVRAGKAYMALAEMVEAYA